MLIAALSCVLVAQEGGLDILEGPTIFADGTLITLSESYRQRSTLFRNDHSVSDPLDRLRQDHRITLGLQHGPLPELTLTALLPYTFRDLEFDSPAGRQTLHSDGFSDASFIAKYRVYKDDWDLNSFALSLLAGVEFPTGSDGVHDDGILLAPTLQPGSGSWDGIFAAAATLQLDRWKFNAIGLHQLQGENSIDHRFGDVSVFEVSAGNRFWIDKYPGPSMNGGLGVQFRHEEPNTLSGSRIAGTGGDFLILKPNLVFHPEPWWDLVLSGEVPVYRDVRGTQLGVDFGIFFAVGYRF